MNSYYGEVVKKNGESVFSAYRSVHLESAAFEDAYIKRTVQAKNSSEKLPKFRKR